MRFKPPRRVALVGPQAPPAGGMARQRDQLMAGLAEAGCEVVVVTTNAAYRPRWVGRTPGLRAVFRLVPYGWRLWRVCGQVDLVHVMANSDWSFHLFATPAVWIARARGVPVAMSYHGGQAQQFLQRELGWLRPTFSAVKLMVGSGFLQSVFADFGMQSVVVPNSVDLSVFHPPIARNAGGHVVVTRNLEAVYDIETAIRAFAQVAECRAEATLTVAGSGPQRDALMALAVALRVDHKVRFVGRLDRAGVAALYREADVMVNASLADNLPNSLLEAMACGVPVVSTRVGGVPWMVRDGESALLVAPKAPEAMAAAITRVLADADLRQKLIHNGAQKAREHAWPAVRERLFSVYAAAQKTVFK